MIKKATIILSAITLIIVLFSGLFIQAETITNNHLPTINNLLIDANTAKKDNKIMLVLFSEHGCTYCEIAKSEALVPISKLPEYQKKVMLREVLPDDTISADFAHNTTTGRDFGHTYDINFYPTLIAINSKGKELAPRLIGIVDKEFYWFKVDELINAATINN